MTQSHKARIGKLPSDETPLLYREFPSRRVQSIGTWQQQKRRNAGTHLTCSSRLPWPCPAGSFPIATATTAAPLLHAPDLTDPSPAIGTTGTAPAPRVRV
ncbi:hypothetical protein SORBI_3009G159800 [Sorghum bicolor]|uniref:Uncharacterized protein n=1 Tax=Sorghum bicolor TaxID=4558 RepID=A0A1B6P8S0_SORBI|nr:hypothetical protein SORBI_3009G159800 [Sorghum bicolor]